MSATAGYPSGKPLSNSSSAKDGQSRYVTPEQLEACRKDPAWEARLGIADRVVCRVCGASPQFPLSGKKGHLWVRHRMSTQHYNATYPGARLSSFKVIARNAVRRHGRCSDVRKLMATRAEHYVTPEELGLYRRDPAREAQVGISNYVVCRVCGAKIRTSLSGSRSDHLLAEHGLNLPQYRRLWPRAPRCSTERAKAVSKASRRWARNHPDEVKSHQATYYKKPEVRKKRRTYSRNYSREVRAFAKIGRQLAPRKGSPGRPAQTDLFIRAKEVRSQGRSWPQCAELLIPKEAAENRHTAAERLRVGVAGLKNLKKKLIT